MTKTCPKCNRKVLKKDSELCAECRFGFTDSYKRRIANGNKPNLDGEHYCQNLYCKNRFEQFARKQMLKYKQFLFCSKGCIEEFKGNNL
jgi:hypothetical protein